MYRYITVISSKLQLSLHTARKQFYNTSLHKKYMYTKNRI